MAVLKVEFNCGCGYKTPDTEEAKSHSDATGHAVHATAIVIPVIRGGNYKNNREKEGQHVIHPKAVTSSGYVPSPKIGSLSTAPVDVVMAMDLGDGFTL